MAYLANVDPCSIFFVKSPLISNLWMKYVKKKNLQQIDVLDSPRIIVAQKLKIQTCKYKCLLLSNENKSYL